MNGENTHKSYNMHKKIILCIVCDIQSVQYEWQCATVLQIKTYEMKNGYAVAFIVARSVLM